MQLHGRDDVVCHDLSARSGPEQVVHLAPLHPLLVFVFNGHSFSTFASNLPNRGRKSPKPIIRPASSANRRSSARFTTASSYSPSQVTDHCLNIGRVRITRFCCTFTDVLFRKFASFQSSSGSRGPSYSSLFTSDVTNTPRWTFFPDFDTTAASRRHRSKF